MIVRVYSRLPNFNKNISPEKGKKTADFGEVVVKSEQNTIFPGSGIWSKPYQIESNPKTNLRDKIKVFGNSNARID